MQGFNKVSARESVLFKYNGRGKIVPTAINHARPPVYCKSIGKANEFPLAVTNFKPPERNFTNQGLELPVDMENALNVPRWYAIYTKPQEEDRVDRNLTAWGVETFFPRIKKKQLNQFTGKSIYFARPLFTRYLFARFDVDRLLHKICYTRGVKSVISFNHMPVVVDDEIITLIRSQVDAEGFVQLNDELKRGDAVCINNGSMKGLNGVFDRTLKDKSRVMILLTAINYQASVIVEKDLIQKASHSYCSV